MLVFVLKIRIFEIFITMSAFIEPAEERHVRHKVARFSIGFAAVAAGILSMNYLRFVQLPLLQSYLPDRVTQVPEWVIFL